MLQISCVQSLTITAPKKTRVYFVHARGSTMLHRDLVILRREDAFADASNYTAPHPAFGHLLPDERGEGSREPSPRASRNSPAQDDDCGCNDSCAVRNPAPVCGRLEHPAPVGRAGGAPDGWVCYP